MRHFSQYTAFWSEATNRRGSLASAVGGRSKNAPACTASRTRCHCQQCGRLHGSHVLASALTQRCPPSTPSIHVARYYCWPCQDAREAVRFAEIPWYCPAACASRCSSCVPLEEPRQALNTCRGVDRGVNESPLSGGTKLAELITSIENFPALQPVHQASLLWCPGLVPGSGRCLPDCRGHGLVCPA